MIVLDTHALLWWALDPDRLPPAAATAVLQGVPLVTADDEIHRFASVACIW
jgi:PIN domain nuclease of toxin-antitoxin system